MERLLRLEPSESERNRIRRRYKILDTQAALGVLACGYCCKELKPAEVHIDHVFPRCQGGSDELPNLEVSCKSCNSAKGGRTPEQWAAALTERGLPLPDGLEILMINLEAAE